MFLLNSCLDLLTAAGSRQRPFSLSYGAILPSSLTVLLPPAWGYSPCLPVSVCGTGPYGAIAAFLGGAPVPFPTWISVRFRAGVSAPGRDFCAASPHVLSARGAGMYACCPSPAHLCLGLGPGSPRGDKLYPGNLRYPAVRIPTALSLLIPAFSLHAPPRGLAAPLRRGIDAPLPGILSYAPMASVLCFSPVHFRRGASRLVSCYALFEWMAASEPTS